MRRELASDEDSNDHSINGDDTYVGRVCENKIHKITLNNRDKWPHPLEAVTAWINNLH